MMGQSLHAPTARPAASFLSGLRARERLAVLAGLAGVTVLAWGYLALDAARMGGMSAGGPMGMPAMQPMWVPWGPLELALTFAMWAMMMVAMMVPSAAPMILLFAAVCRKRVELGGPYVPTAAFVLGYVAVWTAFSVAATLAQWGLHSAALLSPMTVAASPLLGGALLVAAGAWQWMPLKDACLAKCRSPLGFLLTEWRDGTRGAWVMGLRHGAYCTGCCWALMALLFVGGVMNLLWVVAIAAFVLVEKVAPAGGLLGRVAGVGLVAWGGWMVVAALP
jgi:predicted metal-binding membrane protein